MAGYDSKSRELSSQFQAREETEKEHNVALTGLQHKLRDLERKYELQAVKHEELTLEMDSLRKTAERTKQRAPMSTIEIQTESSDSGYMTNGHPPGTSISVSPRLHAGRTLCEHSATGVHHTLPIKLSPSNGRGVSGSGDHRAPISMSPPVWPQLFDIETQGFGATCLCCFVTHDIADAVNLSRLEKYGMK